jgi:hypothetical protein
VRLDEGGVGPCFVPLCGGTYSIQAIVIIIHEDDKPLTRRKPYVFATGMMDTTVVQIVHEKGNVGEY